MPHRDRNRENVMSGGCAGGLCCATELEVELCVDHLSAFSGQCTFEEVKNSNLRGGGRRSRFRAKARVGILRLGHR